jgi:hypothetical protein
VLLHYPSDWRTAGNGPGIPGLALSHSLTLAPGGDASRAGLIVGQLPAGESDPVPQGLIAIAHQLQGPEVVSLPEAQAYRYSRLSIPGFHPQLTLYAIPSPGGPSTALACYAVAPSGEEMAACEQVVSTLTLAGQSQSYSLTPVPAYTHQLDAWFAAMDRERLSVRAGMARRPGPVTLQRLATRLEAIFAKAASGLSALEASLATGSAQVRLAASLWRARDAYAALAAVAIGQDPASLSSARKQIEGAETEVNWALERFAWLGYARA